MPHLDLNGFQRYAGQQKAWSQARFAPIEDANWQWTEKKGAVAFWPIGGQEIEPIVNFRFTETPPAEGEKSLDNPSTIQGVSSVNVVRGSGNIIEYTNFHHSSDILRGQYVDNEDGSVSLNQSFNLDGNAFIYRNNTYYDSNMGCYDKRYTTYLPQGTYRIGLLIEGGTSSDYSCYIRYRTAPYIASEPYTGTTEDYSWASYSIHDGKLIVAPEGGLWYTYLIWINKTSQFSNFKIRPYLYDVSLESEINLNDNHKQQSFKQSISFGSEYYGGSLNARTGLLSVSWVGGIPPIEYVYSKSNDLVDFAWHYNGNYRFYGASETPTKIACTHFPNIINDSIERMRMSGNNDGTPWGGLLSMSKSRIGGSDLSDSQYLANAKQWLLDNNVIFAAGIYYPYTVQLNSTQVLSLLQKDKYTPRLNTFYSDQESVQVGYRKSPIRNELERVQSILDLGGV